MESLNNKKTIWISLSLLAVGAAGCNKNNANYQSETPAATTNRGAPIDESANNPTTSPNANGGTGALPSDNTGRTTAQDNGTTTIGSENKTGPNKFPVTNQGSGTVPLGKSGGTGTKGDQQTGR